MTILGRQALILATIIASAQAACVSDSTSTSPTEPPSAASPLGTVVTEIDPRIWILHEDRDGNLWFGSNGNGAYRFDGSTITQFTTDDGLPGHQVRGIQDDSRGNLIISTNSGVSRFDGTSFTTLDIIEGGDITEAGPLDPDDVWVAHKPGEYGPMLYDGTNLIHFPLTGSPAAPEPDGEQPPFSWDPAAIYTISKDRRGHLWFGTAAYGLCRFDGTTLSWMHEERLTHVPNGGVFGIRCIYEDRDGAFWICNTSQRFRFKPESRELNGKTLLTYDKERGLPDSQDDGASFSYYHSMLEDDDGVMWMACGSDGVWSVQDDTVTKYSLAEGAYVLGLICDRRGRVWASTLEHGVYVFDGTEFTRFTG